MITLTTGKTINAGLFKEELAAAGLVGVFHRILALDEGGFRIEVDTLALYEPTVQAVIDAHDHMQLSAAQAQQAEAADIRAGAEVAARDVPDVIGWTPTEAGQWVKANATDVVSAKLAIKRSAQMVAAFNARVYPALRAEARQQQG